MLVRIGIASCLVLAVAGGLLLAGVGLGTPSAGGLTAAEAEAAALRWVGTGVAQTPRRDGGEWEVDVRRPDGSLVEVTIGDGAELLGLDEEAGPGGSGAPDEIGGALRARAVRAAETVTGRGRALSVERDVAGEIEVDIQRPDGVVLEVELGPGMRVTEVEREDRGDE